MVNGMVNIQLICGKYMVNTLQISFFLGPRIPYFMCEYMVNKREYMVNIW